MSRPNCDSYIGVDWQLSDNIHCLYHNPEVLGGELDPALAILATGILLLRQS